MDEGLDYSSEEQLRKVSSAWTMGPSASIETLSRDPSKLYLQFKNYHLHLVQPVEYPSWHRKIPSTKAERYSFYRSYTTMPNKSQIVCMSTGSFNIMFWTYIFNGFFKSLPHTYTNLFLASYSPEEHLFIPKMVPFFYGTKFAFILTSVFELLICFTQIMHTFGYLIHGIAHKNPWNRCIRKSFKVDKNIINCLELPEFYAKIKNTTWKFQEKYYVTTTGEKFQLVQVESFRYFYQVVLNRKRTFFYFIILWSAILFSHKYIYKRMFWKLQHRLQLTLVFVEIVLFIYLMHSSIYEVDVPELPHADDLVMSDILSKADVDFVAESITAPPIVHFLTARSTQEISPSHDSFLLCLSNAISYLFRAVLINRVRIHCKNLAGAPLQLTQFSPYSWFYFWPLLFSQFYWGDLYTLAFFILFLCIDFTSIIITYHCILEILLREWSFLKEWMVNASGAVVCLIIYLFTKKKLQITIYVYTTVVMTFVEIFVIYNLYPVGRLIDDVLFHFGAPPTTLRQLVWRLMPVFYFIKLYIMIHSLSQVRKLSGLLKLEEWIFLASPYVVGMICVAYKYMIVDKRNWQRMFVPDRDWGPQDHQVRQLRKEFDSRTYIGSQAARHLSRYIISKHESKAFQLNLNYDPSRRSTMPTTMYRMDTEKKDT